MSRATYRHEETVSAAESPTVPTTLASAAERDDVPPVQVPEQFCVHDERTANWVVQHVTAAVAYREKVKGWADTEMRRAQMEEAWFRRRFGTELLDWARAQIKGTQGKRKSINLPAGVIGFRRSREQLVIDDEVAVLSWARRHCPEAVVIVERVSKSAMNNHFAQTGEVPTTGVHIEPASEQFFIR